MGQEEHDLRVDYVEFPATDLEVIKAFYVTVFGWEFQDFGPDYSAFRDGRISGGFHTLDRPGGSGGALVVIYAVDLEGAEANVVKHGGTVVKQIFEFPGGRRFHFSDPSGNVLAVWSER